MMKKAILILTLLITIGAQAQSNNVIKPNPMVPKWRFGGNIGMQFGTYTFIRLAPTVERRLNNWYYLGGTVDYAYSKYKYDDYSQSILGLGILNTFYPWRSLFMNANFMSHNARFVPNGKKEWLNSLWLGGGYMVRTGPTMLSIGFQYNVLDNPEKRIYDPFMPVFGVSVGL